MYEESTEFILEDQVWSTVNKDQVVNAIRELIGIGASKLLPAMLDWVQKR